jgi:hypothetical protein
MRTFPAWLGKFFSVNVGAGRKKDCLKKLAAIPILLRSVNGILRIGWSVNGMSMKQGKPWCYIGKWEGRVRCRFTK